MISNDVFGPEKVLEVFDYKSGLHGFVVIDNTALGPGKGGIRMTPGVSVEEVFKLARTMTWKTSMAGLPFGGAKAGIAADPRNLTQKQKDAMMAAFGKALRPVCPSLYVSAPDINTAEHEMGVFAKANGSLKACTGKPKKMGGIPHELGSTGFGVFHAAKVAARLSGIELSHATVAVEGFGNVGSFAAKFLEKEGAKIVAVSDSKGIVYCPDGFDVAMLSKVKSSTGSVVNYEGTPVSRVDSIVSLKVDILVPAAVPDLITPSNVGSVQARLIVEGSNITMAPELEEQLHARGIRVVPDFVANAGGVISSYVEYIKGTPKKMFELVEKKVSANTLQVLKASEKKGVSPRMAAEEIAMQRVVKAMKKRKS